MINTKQQQMLDIHLQRTFQNIEQFHPVLASRMLEALQTGILRREDISLVPYSVYSMLRDLIQVSQRSSFFLSLTVSNDKITAPITAEEVKSYIVTQLDAQLGAQIEKNKLQLIAIARDYLDQDRNIDARVLDSLDMDRLNTFCLLGHLIIKGRIKVAEIIMASNKEIYCTISACLANGTLSIEEASELPIFRPFPTNELFSALNSSYMDYLLVDRITEEEILALSETTKAVLLLEKVKSLHQRGILSLQQILSLSEMQGYAIDHQNFIYDFLVQKIMTPEQVLTLTPERIVPLLSQVIRHFIAKGIISVDRAMSLTRDEKNLLETEFHRTNLLNGTLNVELALAITGSVFDILLTAPALIPHVVSGALPLKKLQGLSYNEVLFYQDLGKQGGESRLLKFLADTAPNLPEKNKYLKLSNPQDPVSFLSLRALGLFAVGQGISRIVPQVQFQPQVQEQNQDTGNAMPRGRSNSI